MHPILFKLGPVTLYSYGAMLVVAFVVTTWLAARAARGLAPHLVAIAPEQITDFSCWSLLGGILGARLLYIMLKWDFFMSAPQELPAIWHGGLVWYGGFLGGLAAGWGYVRSQRLSFLRVMDQFIPFLALGHAIGRVGCFLNGCCYGKPTELWCGVVFPGQSVRVLPTQLFEAGGLVVLFGVLRRLQSLDSSRMQSRDSLGISPHGQARGAPQRWLRHPGRLFGLYLVSYAAFRFIIEFLRGDQPIWWAGLTLQQLISLGMFVVGLFLLFRVSGLGSRV